MLKKTTHTKLIVLIDPDKYNAGLITLVNKTKTAYVFVGGSVLKNNNIDAVIKSIKLKTKIPVIIFPGDETQITKRANAILMLSLLSGRNADYLVGKQVLAAPIIKKANLKTIPTGYILVDGGNQSTTLKITKTNALFNNTEVVNTAIAAQLMGKQLVYLEAGSGANNTLTPSLIKKIKNQITIPIIVGGGINTIKKAQQLINAKPDYIVIGNALEIDPNFLLELNFLFK